MNKNRIVRVFNNDIHACISRVSRELGLPYQTVFDELCLMFVRGYVFGFDTHQILFKRLVERLEE